MLYEVTLGVRIPLDYEMMSAHSLIVKVIMRQECIKVGYIPPTSVAIPCLLRGCLLGRGDVCLVGRCLSGGSVCLVGVSVWWG